MHAEIISIGDELANGQRLDTNSQWLSQQLGDLGLRVLFHTTVGDDLQSNIDVFRVAAGRADIVICTGGLGPTADDLTREAMSEAFHRPLEMDEASLKHIEQLFAFRKRPMPERNRVQALFPSGSQVIPNPHGSAPGIDLKVAGSERDSRFFALPGVPAEMREMFLGTIVDRLRIEHGIGQKRLFYKSIKLFGIGESDVEVRLPDLIRRDRKPQVGITVSRATITLRIATEASSLEESQQRMESTVREIYDSLGDLIFGEGEIELEDAVIQWLQKSNERLVVVEIGPESVVSRSLMIADANMDHRIAGGLLFRDRAQVVDFLARWPWETLNDDSIRIECDPSFQDSRKEEWRSLAVAARKIHSADWVLLLGNYPERAEVQSSKGIPIASLVVGLLSPENELTLRTFELGAHPDVLYHRLAKTALDQLRRKVRDGKISS